MAEQTTDAEMQIAALVTNELSSRSSTVTSPFRLMDLPPELRLQIYEYAFPEREFDFHLGNTVTYGTRNAWRSREPGIISLLCSCQTVYREALPVLFERSMLGFMCWDGTAMASVCWDSVSELELGPLEGFAAFRHAKRVEISAGPGWNETHEQVQRTSQRVLALLDSGQHLKSLVVRVSLDHEELAVTEGDVIAYLEVLGAIKCTSEIDVTLQPEEWRNLGPCQDLIERSKARIGIEPPT